MRSIAILHAFLVSSFWRISTTVFKTCRYVRTKFFLAQGSIRVSFLLHFRMSHNGSFAARGKKSLPSILRGRMKYCYSDSMIKVRFMVFRAFHCLSSYTAESPLIRPLIVKGQKNNYTPGINTPYCYLINSRSVEVATDNNWKTLFKIRLQYMKSFKVRL